MASRYELTKVVSGGQTGADQAGLRAARAARGGHIGCLKNHGCDTLHGTYAVDQQ